MFGQHPSQNRRKLFFCKYKKFLGGKVHQVGSVYTTNVVCITQTLDTSMVLKILLFFSVTDTWILQWKLSLAVCFPLLFGQSFKSKHVTSILLL